MHIELIEIGNFRKLKSVRIDISKETTVFVGANNSGKTSAMIALRYFLQERERTKLSLEDFTLSHWPAIDKMGEEWEERQKSVDREIQEPNWLPYLPFIDVWIHAEIDEAHLVQALIPTLDWNGGRLGVRLRLEPRNTAKLRDTFLTARNEARSIEEISRNPEANDQNGQDIVEQKPLLLWPRSLTDFMRRHFWSHFIVRSYILDPAKLEKPQNGHANPQDLPVDLLPLEKEPFKGLIYIREIPAQRGFGQTSNSSDADDDTMASSAANRPLSEQLRNYWNRHLDPFEHPDREDIDALRAIDQAQKIFDERLRAGFIDALEQVENLGYPGVTDPKVKISTDIKPVDGLKHNAAVQYILPMGGNNGEVELKLPESSNGLGYQNLISMVFRLMSFRDAWMRKGKAGKSKNAESNPSKPLLQLVLLEEPEAHLHTQVQQVFIWQAYKVLRNHSDLKCSKKWQTQLVVSTHSSHIALACKFEQLRYFRRLPAAVGSVPTSSVVNLGSVFGENEETERFVTRYIKITHCDLFFADAAVILEGSAERILVPFFVQHHQELLSLHKCYITWLEINGSHSHRLQSLIEQLGLTTLIITDVDATADNKSVCPQLNKDQTTRNETLKSWCPGIKKLDELMSLEAADKEKCNPENQSSVRVAYQCPVNITFKEQEATVLCNTFEDALVMQNLGVLAEGDHSGLRKKIKDAIDSSSSADELSRELFDELKNTKGKAEFALELLYLENPTELQPPEYIVEGLKWLVERLNASQTELSPPSATQAPQSIEAVTVND